MLEVTIYKVAHGNNEGIGAISQARKLLPYIKNSDIFSLELLGYSKEQALNAANVWSRVLADKSSNRARMRRLMKHNLSHLFFEDNREYLLTTLDYMFRNKVGIWFAEQTPSKELGTKINDRFGKAFLKWDTSLQELRRGLPRQKQAYDAMKDLCAVADERDQLIVSTLAESEAILRQVYPFLEKKEKISYGIPLGAFHELDKRLPDAKVIDLSGSKEEDLGFILNKKVRFGAPLEDVVPLINKIACVL